MKKAKRALLDEAVAVAARSRELFPYGGFEDLDNAELQILLATTAHPGGSVREIAAALRFEQPTMSRPVSGLEDRGLIEVTKDPGDGRRKLLAPTQPGLATVRRYLTSVD